jgi:hypothetical protein
VPLAQAQCWSVHFEFVEFTADHHLLLVQREMESWRAPLASIAPIPADQFASQKAVAACGSSD